MKVPITRSPRVHACAFAVAVCAAAHGFAAAATPRIETNEAYIEAVTRPADLSTSDVMAVFAFVFASLPDRVKVYPTEDYYYFRFYAGGVSYGGNIRLQNGQRDEGKVHFAYGPESADAADGGEGFHKLLTAADGIAIEKVEPLVYRLTFRGKTVTFALNDLSNVKPPADLLAPNERTIGPVFDESGIRFFLVYNERLKVFHYLLDETVPVADVLKPSKVNERILIGQRTRFAFYRDHRRERKILIGVLETNALANNYFDGPFDQLPDNFIEGESLRSAILEVEPELKGKIDRFGSTFDGETRYLIAPYLYYQAEQELLLFHRCATNRRIPANRYYACFAIDETAGRPRTQAERD